MGTPERLPEGEKRESIMERREIVAPPNFVSVFHETKETYLPSIDQQGLKIDFGTANIGSPEIMGRKNKGLDQFRPEELKAKGISRSNIYAYPFLEYGSGLMGADERFIRRDERDLKTSFESSKEYSPNYLRMLGVNTLEEYIRKMTDPEYLKTKHPGEVVELKVDPQKCYVGDLEYINRIMQDMDRGWSESEALQNQGEQYWKNLITLEDFLRWYKKPEWADDGNSIKDADDYRDGDPCTNIGFCPLKGAPVDFPYVINYPEILIPEDVPQEHIKLVK